MKILLELCCTCLLYTSSEDLGNADTDYLKEVDERGISAFEAALSKYGFTRERFSDTSDGFINYSNMKYDENEVSERHICYIQHGIDVYKRQS